MLNTVPTRHFSRKRSNVRRQKRVTLSNISEDAQTALKNILYDWKQDDSQDELKLSKALTVEERKYIHGLAWRNNLKSKSRGKGEKRYITLSKDREFWNQRVSMTGSSKDNKDPDGSLPVFRLEPEASSTLKRYLEQFPSTEDMETSAAQEYLIDFERNSRMSNRPPITVKNISRRKMKDRKKWHYDGQKTKLMHPEYGTMKKKRAKLPAFKYRKDICDVVRNNRVTLLTGDTGKQYLSMLT